MLTLQAALSSLMELPSPAANFSAVGTSGFQAAVESLTSGVHTTSSNGVHGITVEGYNGFDSYVYPGGALFSFINPTGDANLPICEVEIAQGPPPSASGKATDDRLSEDTNNNGVLDPGEDLNNNGVIDTDSGIFFVELEPGAVNLSLTVDPFVPGDNMVGFTVDLIDTNIPGSGVVVATDGAGNTCRSVIDLVIDEEPTVVTLTSFTATENDGAVVIEWETETEVDTAGFNVRRFVDVTGNSTQINKTLIEAKGGITWGATYSFTDSDVVAGQAYDYVLEEVEFDGDSELHGSANSR